MAASMLQCGVPEFISVWCACICQFVGVFISVLATRAELCVSGSAAAMSLGWGLANRHYSPTQVGCVISATVGAGIATLGCYQATSIVPEGAVTTSGAMFLVGLGLLIGNLLNDAGLAVYQAHVFDQHGKFVDEVVMMQGLLGSLLMSLVCGREAVGFIWSWIQEPVWYSVTDGILVPAELLFLSFNFVGNWNSKKRCTWLTANATAVISSLVPMLYRLISTLISTQLSGALILPAYTWLGILLVFVGSAGYLLANHITATATLNKSKSHKSLDEFY